MDIHEIEIIWEGPYDYKKIISEFKLDDTKRVDFGLYMIYGPHMLYSNKKRPEVDKILLYVGMTVKGSYFSGRIKNHGFCHDNLHEIYLGRIEVKEPDPECKNWEKDVIDAEKLIINRYAPPYNSSLTGDIRNEHLSKKNIKIINLEMKMDLEETIDSNDVVFDKSV